MGCRGSRARERPEAWRPEPPALGEPGRLGADGLRPSATGMDNDDEFVDVTVQLPTDYDPVVTRA